LQSQTIEQLKSYTTLNEKHSEAVKIVQKYQQIVQESIRTYFSKFFEETTRKLGITASEHLSELVMSLNIDSETNIASDDLQKSRSNNN
jgi:hypothetical protein